jgi:hypothetical protein
MDPFFLQFIEPIEDLEASCELPLEVIAVSENGRADIAPAFDGSQERLR